MKKTVFLTVGLTSSLLMSGCATIFGGGSEQKISIRSDKPIANIEIGYVADDNKTMETVIRTFNAPDIIQVKRENKHLLVRDKSGKCQDALIKKDMNPWVAGDILATSPLSTTVDYLTGAMWEYDDGVTLECTK